MTFIVVLLCLATRMTTAVVTFPSIASNCCRTFCARIESPIDLQVFLGDKIYKHVRFPPGFPLAIP